MRGFGPAHAPVVLIALSSVASILAIVLWFTRATHEPDPRLARVSRLAGTWITRGEGTITEERWSEARGGSMLGTSRTIQGDRTVFWEHLRIELRNQDIVYVARPKGGPETEFLLAAPSGAGELVFENPAHDFPQRIIYRRIGAHLVARIEGTERGKPRTAEWRFERAPEPE